MLASIPYMESHELLKRAFRKTSPKAVASDLGISLSLVYKWAEKPTDDGSGSRNPIDRLLQIIELTEDTEIVEWLCRKQGGTFVKDPEVKASESSHVFVATQEIISQFSIMLSEISAAVQDHSVTKNEAGQIRQCWDKLKSQAETFVRSCEAGNFRKIGSEAKSG